METLLSLMVEVKKKKKILKNLVRKNYILKVTINGINYPVKAFTCMQLYIY